MSPLRLSVLVVGIVTGLASLTATAQEVAITSVRPGTDAPATPFDFVVTLPAAQWKLTVVSVNGAKVSVALPPQATFAAASIPAAQRKKEAADYKIQVAVEGPQGETAFKDETLRLDANGLPATKQTLPTGGFLSGKANSSDILKAASGEIGAGTDDLAKQIADLIPTTAKEWTVRGLPRRGVARRDLDPIETTTQLEAVFSRLALRAYEEHHRDANRTPALAKEAVGQLEKDLRLEIRAKVYLTGPFVEEEWQPFLLKVEEKVRSLATSNTGIKLNLENELHVALVMAAISQGFGELRHFHESFDNYFGSGGGQNTNPGRGVYSPTGGYAPAGGDCCDKCRRHRRHCGSWSLLLGI